jgi:hypothetical protein
MINQKYRLIVSAFALFSMFIIASCSGSSEQENINKPQIFRISEGIEVSLVAPDGFNITQEHYGFAQVESFTRIKINEKELSFADFTKSLTKDNLLKSKLQLIDKEQIDIQGALCNLYTLRQNIAGTYFEKLWLVSGDNLSSIVVEASYPEGSNSKHKKAVKQSLLSLTVATDQNKRLYTGLPFKFTDTPGYKVKQRFSNSVILESVSANDNENYLVVLSHGATEQNVENIQTLADHFLNNGKHFKNVDVITNEMIKLNKIPALATTANVEVKDVAYKVFQVVSYQKGRFLLVQGQTVRDKSKNLKDSVNNLLNNFEFK